MALNPIPYGEIEAYARLMLVEMTAWQVGLIRRLDRAVLNVVNGQSTKPAPKPSDPPEAIPMDNPAGLKALFRGLAAKKQGKR